MLSIRVAFALTALMAMGGQVRGEDWWEHMQLYQIYPRSYLDSDGDGIGDLKGIKERFNHLADIGVTATWLSPIFVSPMKDFGYDIADFYKIAEEYGTLEDLQDLIAEGKRLGIKILLDFVPNHSSDLCEWFVKSANKTPGYENYYVWHPGKVNSTGHRIPPSNWVSVFRGPAWTWHAGRQEYYLHQFLPEQPDLNYRDPKLVAEMKNVLRYWLDQGVDGFRVDAIPHLVEVDVDANGNYPDEPISGNTDDEDDYGYLDHIYTRERDETFDQVYQWRKVLDDYAAENGTETLILLMEAMSDIDIVMQYYGNATTEGAHMPFNFELTFSNKNDKAESLKRKIDYFFSKLPEGRITNWVVGNHDQHRMATRYTPQRSDGILMLSFLLPGASVTYLGEEIRMENFYISWEDTQDPQACNSGIDLFNITSRDPERTPFQWNNSINAGFSTANKTWLPVADTYQTLNLDAQKAAARSPYKLYKALSTLRRAPIIKFGSLKIEALNEDILVFTRSNEQGQAIVTVINCGDRTRIENLRNLFPELPNTLQVNIPSVDSPRSQGDSVNSNSLTINPYEALVLMTA